MSTLSASLKKWEKAVHLVFGVAVNKRYRTVFGMEKIDQGRHEGALTTTTFSPHRHDNSFLIIGFVTHFLALVCLSAKVSQARKADSMQGPRGGSGSDCPVLLARSLILWRMRLGSSWGLFPGFAGEGGVGSVSGSAPSG